MSRPSTPEVQHSLQAIGIQKSYRHVLALEGVVARAGEGGHQRRPRSRDE
jgi:hypothetical protein